MVGLVESPRGTNTPRVEELPRGGETSRVTLEGDGVPGADRQGRGGYRKSSATQDIKSTTNTRRGEYMVSVQGPAVLPSATWGTAEVVRGG